MTTIVITGGHHNSALVVAEELARQGVKVIWIGHRYASRDDHNDSAEYREVKEQKIAFHPLEAGRMSLAPGELLRLPLGLISAYRLLGKTRPDAILTFGGYIGATTAIVGWLLGVPIYLHEQTVTAGLANKLIGRMARRVYLTWESSKRHFRANTTQVVGLPLRDSIKKAKTKKMFVRNKPTLLIMGGKQGSHIINKFIFEHIRDILTHYNVVHQTGTNSSTNDYERAIELHKTLGSFRDSYLPLGYIGQSEIGSYLASSNCYLGRSGAHITYELAVMGIPSILVPYTHTHESEQYQNAAYLESIGQGKIIMESHLSLKLVLVLLKSHQKSDHQAVKLPLNSAQVLADDLLKDLRGD